jgi:glycosyltransferase involved in cell wall biosynthesis
MKIGFDAKRAFLNNSGLGNYSRNTLNALNNYFPGNDYVLFTPEIKTGLFKNYDEFDVISPQSPVSRLFKSLWRSFLVSRQLKNNNIDVFHGLSNELPNGTHKNRIPSVVTIHDLIFLRFPQFYKSLDRKMYYRKVKYACNSADKIIAISNQTKADIIHYLNINPDKIKIVYQSISTKFFERFDTPYLDSKYNLPEKFILAVGTLEQRKNQLAILQAIKKSHIEMPILFIGKPTAYSESLLRFITGNEMENQVRFLNNVPGKDLAGLYQKAVLSVYLSVFEGFGLPIIESMASGCPVLTSNLSCLPETAGEAALLCDPENILEIGEKIKLVLENETVRNKLIFSGLERAKLFHPEHYSKSLISLYSMVLSE